MTDSSLIQQALAAYESRTERQRAQAAAHEAAQEDMRSGLVQLKKSIWNAHAAFVLFENSQPGLVDVQWTIPRETARAWDLVYTEPDVTAKPKGSNDGTKFVVTASIGDGISLVLELYPKELDPVYQFLAVKQDDSRNYTTVANLGDLGEAIASFRRTMSASR